MTLTRKKKNTKLATVLKSWRKRQDRLHKPTAKERKQLAAVRREAERRMRKYLREQRKRVRALLRLRSVDAVLQGSADSQNPTSGPLSR